MVAKLFVLSVVGMLLLSVCGDARGNTGDSELERRGLKVIYAVNAGGDAHRDVYGVVYQKDPSNLGIASDYGMRLNIDRVHPQDEILYQTERYSHSTFGYEIPIPEDGAYILVLKFAEVFFRSPRQKIFDVVLNTKHAVLENLDIFERVGTAAAYDAVIPFHVSDNGKTLVVAEDRSEILRKKIRLDFVKGPADNPKINAFFVAKGSEKDVPATPPPRYVEDGEAGEEDYLFSEDDEEIRFNPTDLGYDDSRKAPSPSSPKKTKRVRIRSGSPTDDPWELESPLTVYMPLIGSLAASILSFFVLRVVNKL